MSAETNGGDMGVMPDCDTTHHAGCKCHEQGWHNKWQCAVEMAARAEVEKDDLKHHLKDVLEALQAMACRHKCGCGHPHCNRCADDIMCQEAIVAVKGGKYE